jgi:hypothetical protein
MRGEGENDGAVSPRLIGLIGLIRPISQISQISQRLHPVENDQWAVNIIDMMFLRDRGRRMIESTLTERRQIVTPPPA